MKKEFGFRNKWGRKQARKAIPLFASFFLGQFPLPAGNIADKTPVVNFAPMSATLQFIQFELEIYNLYEEIGLEKAGLNLEVFNQGVVGYLNLIKTGAITNKSTLTIADFDKNSSEKRLWVIDINARKILHHTLVAHGKNSGVERAERFSNVSQSEMSSLGFYVTEGTYTGKHGLSLKIRGMDEGFNKNAYNRHVVVHGAEYVSEEFVKEHGRLGRSQGCPALPMDDHQDIIKEIEGGSVLYLHASMADYQSSYLDPETAMHTYFSEEVSIANL
ncbi:murein L,D-transpeptidase catalytic domain family protein [Adhaeribacter aquaticus]|uniref:murein L,D-transpeptidase catalytic domain family protein n=1 Tax=Adhaeribacter aquaticus TaxID=299567 RepID=UPI0003F6A62B|nr:murein L,D-transpeptidase catalytic domain family protein [Adhaeribacter aquaticus]